MSCRVIGRQVEDALADRICRDANKAGCAIVAAEYIPSAKNNLAADFWENRFQKTGVRTNAIGYELPVKEYQPKILKYLNFGD